MVVINNSCLFVIGCQQQQFPHKELVDYKCKLTFTLHLDPEDYAHDQKAREWIENADYWIALTAFEHPRVMQKATIMLPAGLLAENEGHYLNCFGAAELSQQGIHGLGETKPAWKILAVLIESLTTIDTVYRSINDIPVNLKITQHVDLKTKKTQIIYDTDKKQHALLVIQHPYALDPILRRSDALHATQDALLRHELWLSSDIAALYSLKNGEKVRLIFTNGSSFEKAVREENKLAVNTIIYWTGLFYEDVPVISGPVQLRKVLF
jgi:NADH-quinone oxidoreductase subunit G